VFGVGTQVPFEHWSHSPPPQSVPFATLPYVCEQAPLTHAAVLQSVAFRSVHAVPSALWFGLQAPLPSQVSASEQPSELAAVVQPGPCVFAAVCTHAPAEHCSQTPSPHAIPSALFEYVWLHEPATHAAFLQSSGVVSVHGVPSALFVYVHPPLPLHATAVWRSLGGAHE
jgi:hypothetical protein